MPRKYDYRELVKQKREDLRREYQNFLTLVSRELYLLHDATVDEILAAKMPEGYSDGIDEDFFEEARNHLEWADEFFAHKYGNVDSDRTAEDEERLEKEYQALLEDEYGDEKDLYQDLLGNEYDDEIAESIQRQAQLSRQQQELLDKRFRRYLDEKYTLFDRSSPLLPESNSDNELQGKEACGVIAYIYLEYLQNHQARDSVLKEIPLPPADYNLQECIRFIQRHPMSLKAEESLNVWFKKHHTEVKAWYQANNKNYGARLENAKFELGMTNSRGTKKPNAYVTDIIEISEKKLEPVIAKKLESETKELQKPAVPSAWYSGIVSSWNDLKSWVTKVWNNLFQKTEALQQKQHDETVVGANTFAIEVSLEERELQDMTAKKRAYSEEELDEELDEEKQEEIIDADFINIKQQDEPQQEREVPVEHSELAQILEEDPTSVAYNIDNISNRHSEASEFFKKKPPEASNDVSNEKTHRDSEIELPSMSSIKTQ